ncbi:MAG: aspartate kinase [Candidatus Aminicenantes bacterium]|nr:aspartate kinase [Candidatus Aminicenantes bacterium]
MITITDEINRMIATSPFLEEGIQRGIINLSALAREMKPILESNLFKSLSDGAVIMALKRVAEKMGQKRDAAAPKKRMVGDLIVRSNLSEFTYQISENTTDHQRTLLKETKKERGQFVTITRGIDQLTIIISSIFNDAVKKIFRNERLIQQIDDLASITCKLYAEVIFTPGIFYTILKLLAWENINVIEVVSTYTEFTIILERGKIDQSFSILMKYFHFKDHS